MLDNFESLALTRPMLCALVVVPDGENAAAGTLLGRRDYRSRRRWCQQEWVLVYVSLAVALVWRYASAVAALALRQDWAVVTVQECHRVDV